MGYHTLPQLSCIWPPLRMQSHIARGAWEEVSASVCLYQPATASHDKVYPPLLKPPRTAKRPSLITLPQEPYRSTLVAGSCVQVHATLDDLLAGGPHTFAEAGKPNPPTHATRPSVRRTAAKLARLLRVAACGVPMPVARSTRARFYMCTDDKTTPYSSRPPSRST